MAMPSFFDFSMVSQPADKTETLKRVYMQGVLYDLKGYVKETDPLDSYRVCVNCDKILKYHIDLKCPFDTTEFFQVYDFLEGRRE
jgi:hypothetical protein